MTNNGNYINNKNLKKVIILVNILFKKVNDSKKR